jgi:tRNA A-37 threonylcarbamoyl transferase component Bud32
MNIKIPKKKDELIKMMLKCFQEYEKYRLEKYEKLEQLGNKGKEGITYLVKDKKTGKIYAMKTFKKNKSINNIKKEAELQSLAAEFGISPVVIDVDIINKTIVMEKMDKHLFDIMKLQNGDLTETQQKQIIKIYKTLDEAKVFHGDSNILNYMYKGKKLYIIDFGMSKKIDELLIKKLGTNTPNMDIMTLGFILKLKELNCPKSSYVYLLKFVGETEKIRFDLI